jgi:type II secretory pathway pseudopilin PulG
MLPAILSDMTQGGSREASGFTITETLIVLAVTGVLFLSAVILINGRQGKTQFQTAIITLQQQIQQVANETLNGYYPRDTSFTCVRGSSAPPTLTTAASTDRQGQNAGCIFMGKVLQFGVQGTNPQTYAVMPMVGNRMDTTNAVEASTLYGTTGAFPEAAVATVGAPNNTLTGADSSVVLQQGMTVGKMWYDGNAANKTSTVAFISTLPTADGAGVASGSQHLSLYTVATTDLGQSTAQTATAIYPVSGSQPLVAVSSVSICVASGTTNQWGLITIGQSGAQAASLSVKLDIKSTSAC